MTTPYDMIREFERKVADYAGAPYGVAVDSCTAALFLSCQYCQVAGHEVTIPKRTYVSVPCEIIHAGGQVAFEDLEWRGAYQLKPFPVWDAAKRFHRGMYQPGTYW